MFGVDDVDDNGSMIDRELGDRIIALHQNVHSFSGSIKDMCMIVQSASEMTRILLNLQNRLKYLLEKTRFAEELYELICTLGFPERAHSTFIRAARALQTFMNVRFHIRPHSPAKTVSFATPTTSSTQSSLMKPSSPRHPEKSKRIQRFEGAATVATTSPSSSSSPPPSSPPKQGIFSLGPLMTAVQPYLPRKDRNLALAHLQCAAKQQTAHLIGTILQKKLLSIKATAWYSFAFVITKNEEQEQRLAGLYLSLLREADNSETIFRELQTALEKDELVALFDKHEYGHFRQLFPFLETFLKTPPKKRWTVWRLRQFTQDPVDDEPPACLQRDYGFKFCRQREEVLRLKAIYTRMLRKMGPKNLHTACIHGRLFETAIKEGLSVDMKDRRFMQNDYPSPFVGLDDDGDLEAYRGPFYKRRLKL